MSARRRILQALMVLGPLAVVVVVGAAATLTGLYVDWLWFDSLDFGSVFNQRLGTQLGLWSAGAAVAWVWLALNWFVLPRRLLTQMILQVRGGRTTRQFAVGAEALTVMMALFAAVVGLFFAFAASRQWMPYLMFRHATPFGLSDPIFGRDAGFYVFSLPFYRAMLNWLLWLLGLTLAGILLIYGLARMERRERLAAHLSLVGALFLLGFAARYQVGRWLLLNSAGGVVYGASYTDVYARLPLLNVLTAIVLLGAVLLVANIFLRRGRLLLWVAGAWLVVTVVGPIYPAIVQRLVVDPNELSIERPYIDHSIDYTRFAYGIEDVQEVDYPAVGQLTEAALEANEETIENIRLWDYRPLLRTYGQLQEIRLYYTFNDVDVDRYVLDGGVRQVMLSAREMDVNQLAESARTWINQHLIFTHGYGLCMSPVNEVSREGLPEFLVWDIPPQITDPALAIERPEIYFGESTSNYVVVNTTEQEFDRPSGNENVYTRYEGPDGVRVGGLLRRLILAWEFNSSQLLFSGALDSDSRILFNRTLYERASTLAPFLWYDADPYLVIADGRLVWLYDAFTWARTFPYSEPSGGLNYIRNSVKITIDAYTGQITFYVVDSGDPLIQTYRAIFPALFRDGDEMPQVLREHWRYPEQLFTIQARILTAYHMRDPNVFYNKEDLWAIPTELVETSEQVMEPYYVVMEPAGSEELQFLITQPFVPAGRQNMIAWLYANSSGDDYGQMVVYKLPKDELIYGPMQIEARFNQDSYISQQLTLWDQRGSEVIRGNLIVVPVADTFLYVEPLYLQAERSQLPELKRILVAYGAQVAMADSFGSALAQVVGATAAPPPVEGAPPSTDVAALVLSAQGHYDAAQACLQRGDWACYGVELEALRGDLEALVAVTGAAPEE